MAAASAFALSSFKFNEIATDGTGSRVSTSRVLRFNTMSRVVQVADDKVKGIVLKNHPDTKAFRSEGGTARRYIGRKIAQ